MRLSGPPLALRSNEGENARVQLKAVSSVIPERSAEGAESAEHHILGLTLRLSASAVTPTPHYPPKGDSPGSPQKTAGKFHRIAPVWLYYYI